MSSELELESLELGLLVLALELELAVTVAAETPTTCGLPTEAVVFNATEAALTAAAKLVELVTKFAEAVCAVWATLVSDDATVAEKVTDVSRRDADAVDVTEQPIRYFCDVRL